MEIYDPYKLHKQWKG